MDALDDDAAADEPGADEPSLVADVFEPPDLVDLVRERGVEVESRRLAPADFVVGLDASLPPTGNVGLARSPERARVLAIERKTIGDFHYSMIRRRLFEQIGRCRETYPRVALLLEGDLDGFYELRNPRASWGPLSAIAVDLGVTILPTPSKEGSADLLATLARRAARGPNARAEVRFKPRALSEREQQKFAIQGLPGIGDTVSDALLAHFGSVRRVFAASEKELIRVSGMGKVRARALTELLDRPYAGETARLPEEPRS